MPCFFVVNCKRHASGRIFNTFSLIINMHCPAYVLIACILHTVSVVGVNFSVHFRPPHILTCTSNRGSW